MTTKFLVFESPNNLTANVPVTITWNPNTFNAVNLGNFSLNLWLLHEDNPSDSVVIPHPGELLAVEQSVYNTSVSWTPIADDVDVGVSEAGAHQLAWEQSKDNPSLSPASTKFEGFSAGFNIKAASSSSSSSSAAATPSSTSSSTAAVQPSANSSGTSHATILGLGIGFGLLLVICVVGAFFGWRLYRRKIEVQKMTEGPPVQNRSPMEIEGKPLPMIHTTLGVENGSTTHEARKVGRGENGNASELAAF